MAFDHVPHATFHGLTTTMYSWYFVVELTSHYLPTHTEHRTKGETALEKINNAHSLAGVLVAQTHTHTHSCTDELYTYMCTHTAAQIDAHVHACTHTLVYVHTRI